MNKKAWIKAYHGFGDNIWLYPFIKEASKKYKKLYLETSFPFLYHSLPNIKFLKPQGCRTLKTCQDYIKAYPNNFWANLPGHTKYIKIPYYLTELKNGKTLVESFNEGINIAKKTIDYTVPLKPEWVKEAHKVLRTIKTDKKLCLIKPPSDRKDWKCPARVPRPEYFQYLIDKYKKEYYFISVGNKDIENYRKELNDIDSKFDYGELALTTILGIASLVDMIITYNCFLFPAGVATKTRTFVIGGGFSDPKLYVDPQRMDLSKVAVVTPTPNCTCLDRKHACNKEIPFTEIEQKFEHLKSEKEQDWSVQEERPLIHLASKRNLLISRMRAERAHKIANNQYINKYFNFFTVDHTSISPYKKFRGEFEVSYQFPSVGDVCRPEVDHSKKKELRRFCRKILKENRIDLVLNAQPLHPYNEAMNRACGDYGIKVINTETFCDDKWLFDYKGCQYTCPNEIYDYVRHIPIDESIPIDLPKETRQPQPDSITKEEFFQKYNLNPNERYIVLLGQLMWDMSIKQTVNPEITDYKQYIDLIFKSNPHTHFIVKHHPLYLKGGRQKEVKFIEEYPNVTIVNESLDTLFNSFDYFTSFSSTTIFEGILRNKKFASIGFHYCNNDDLVVQLRVNRRAKDLYEKLMKLKINHATKQRYLRFICNYYTVDLSSEKLYHRLTKSSEDYFRMKF